VTTVKPVASKNSTAAEAEDTSEDIIDEVEKLVEEVGEVSLEDDDEDDDDEEEVEKESNTVAVKESMEGEPRDKVKPDSSAVKKPTASVVIRRNNNRAKGV
jgi:hypothetical protein